MVVEVMPRRHGRAIERGGLVVPAAQRGLDLFVDSVPDRLHGDITPSVQELGKIGLPVIPHLEAPLRSESEITRLHAQRALEAAVQGHFGFVSGQGFTRPNGEAQFRALWADNGSYSYDGPAAARAQSVDAWMRWSQTTPLPYRGVP